MHPGGRFLCLRTVQKGKPSLLLLQVDVVGQTGNTVAHTVHDVGTAALAALEHACQTCIG